MASVNSSLLRRMRVRLNFPEDVAANWNLPFPNWLHLVDPLRTSTIGHLSNAITSKWRPSSSSTSVFLSIGGYRLDASDPVDILRDDDVLDVMSNQALPPVSRQATFQNQAPTSQQPQQLTQSQQLAQPQQYQSTQPNQRSLSSRRERLSVFHADRSGFGLDLEENGETTQYFTGCDGASNAPTSGANNGASNDATKRSISAEVIVASRSKRDTAEGEGEDRKRKRHKRAKSQIENPIQEEINTAEMVVPAGSTDAAVQDPIADSTENDDASPVKKKKRTRRPKKAKGFDLTLTHGVQSQWQPASTKIPFKIADAASIGGESDSLTNRSHIVFGEENSFMESETADEFVERKAVEEEATEEEEEEEVTDEIEKQRAIAEEDVNGWSPIGNVPKEGDIVAFKVMEMDENYCPQISGFKVGVVKSNQGGKDRLQIRLFNFTRQKIKGKFEMRLKKKKRKGAEEGEDAAEGKEGEEKEGGEELVTENELRKTVPELTIQWNSVIEPKLRPVEEAPVREAPV